MSSTTLTQTSEHVVLKKPPVPKETFRKDYTPALYSIKNTYLDFYLHPTETKVKAELTMYRNKGSPPCDLVLRGECLSLESVSIDDKPTTLYKVDEEDALVLSQTALPVEAEKLFKVSTTVTINPTTNLQLMGLFVSGGIFCTQCEAEGFRRITYYLDRPDVMSKFLVRIEADALKYPVLLSNGNLVEKGLVGGRHFAVFDDPFLKPCYLFALVGGNLESIQDTFKTMSGRTVKLEIFADPNDVTKLQWSMKALKQAMKWDEDAYGREYDLDVFNIVCVNDFNMGAMENKGLNVFNTALLLATPDMSTDADFERIAGVVAHEYFHNWTGDRVTCRDWFQLTLKEGLTVYRDQSFTSDHGSPSVCRISDVIQLRYRQFPEDAGPMAHPIRPESYIAMDNFYTATVYEKGAEVIRMYATILGKDGFRKGMDLYFERHDGQAVTCDDFRAAMADANKRDFTQFERWYTQAGTPVVTVESTRWDASSKTYSVELSQVVPPTPNQPTKLPMHIPVKIGLIGKSSKKEMFPSKVFHFTETKQKFVLEGVEEDCVPSLFREFSAPVKVVQTTSETDLAMLMGYDTDDFNRWEAAQQLTKSYLFARTRKHMETGSCDFEPMSSTVLDAFRAVIISKTMDGSMKALTLRVPSESEVLPDLAPVDPESLHVARHSIRLELRNALQKEMTSALSDCQSFLTGKGYEVEAASVASRALRSSLLGFLTMTGEDKMLDMAYDLFVNATNMSDRMTAIGCLVDHPGPHKEKAMAAFYAASKDDELKKNKWFSLHGRANHDGAVENVQEMTKHADFSFQNPNRMRSLLLAFAANTRHFHRKDGAGYKLLADAVLELDPINSSSAARASGTLINWKSVDVSRQELMKKELTRILNKPGLSNETYEVVAKALV